MLTHSVPLQAAQERTAREVVQPLPNAAVQRLNRALVALDKAPRDLATLLEAGTAAMAVDDLDAAAKFFGRAAEVAPGNPEVAQGLGRLYLRSGRPQEALVQFDLALAGGVPERALVTDRALALDLIGDSSAAQTAYERALVLEPADDEARRRLALSHAIGGNRARFEDTLRPLLDKSDTAALRTRAFGLAILGDTDRARSIAEQVMPRDLSARIAPYLAYMPRLTRSQQAAAANLGIFPRAAEIGREDRRLARFASEDQAASRLEPSGEPLGSTPARSVPLAPPGTRSQPAGPARTERVADAFADLGSAAPPTASVANGAVDVSRLAVRREVAAPPPQPRSAPPPTAPKPPAHPSRVWVQLATGKDEEALAFDWRRFSRSSGAALAELAPHTVRWGAARRLLAGPLDNREKAAKLVRELKAKGLDTFVYVSPEGEAIQPVK